MFFFTSDEFFIKKISHACMGEEDDSNTGGGNAGSQSDSQQSENDNRDNSTGNRDGGTGRQKSLQSKNKASSVSNQDISFEDNDSAMAALGAIQAAALQSDAQTFENTVVASNQARTDVEALVGNLNDVTQQLLAQSVETNVNLDIEERELEGAAKFWSKVGEFFTPATFTGIQNPNTLAGGIDVGLNIGDLIGLPGNSLVELVTGKGILEHTFGDKTEGLFSGAASSAGKSSVTSPAGSDGSDRTERTEGGGDDRNKRFTKSPNGSSKRKTENEKEESTVDKFNQLMDDALKQQLERKIFDMPEFQLLSQIGEK